MPLPILPRTLNVQPAAEPEAANIASASEAAAQASPRHAGSHLAANPPRPRGSQRLAQSITSCFSLGSAAQPGSSQPLIRLRVLSAAERRKQRDASIDQWAATQKGSAILNTVEKLKKVLGTRAVRRFGRRAAVPLTLDMKNNQLTSIPVELGQATALQRLYLSRNQLTSIPAELGEATALQWLDLSDNQLSSIPSELGVATALQHVDLSQNQLTSIPKELGQLTALQRLDLSGNRLTSIPKELGQATALQSLALKDNRLTSIPAELGQATALQQLDLMGNRLDNLPIEIAQLRNLTHLDLMENRFTRMPRFAGITTHHRN